MLYAEPAVLAGYAAYDGEEGFGSYRIERPSVTNPTANRLLGGLIADATDTARPDGLLAVEGALVLLLARLGSSGRPPGRRGIPSAVAHAMTLIDDDPTAPLTLADLAGAAGLGRFQLVRVHALEPPHAPRLPAAAPADLARGLITGGLPLAHAAAQAGFVDQSHMTRTFNAKFGITPAPTGGRLPAMRPQSRSRRATRPEASSATAP